MSQKEPTNREIFEAIKNIGSKINSIENRLDSVDNRLDSVENRLDSIDINLNSLESEVSSTKKELYSLNDKFLSFADWASERIDTFEKQQDMQTAILEEIRGTEPLKTKKRVFQNKKEIERLGRRVVSLEER